MGFPKGCLWYSVWDSHRISMAFLWYFYMVFLCDLHDISMGYIDTSMRNEISIVCLWSFNEISLRFSAISKSKLWNFHVYDISMGFLLDSCGSCGFPWFFYWISMPFLWYFSGISAGFLFDPGIPMGCQLEVSWNALKTSER